jgi:hypothetical protein
LMLSMRMEIAGLRSSHTSCGFRHCPYAEHRLTQRTPTPLSAFRRWEIQQFCLTRSAIYSPKVLSTVPKATTPFANFQLHAQFHDLFSVGRAPG